MATDMAELREVMYRVIEKMVEEGTLVPIYDGDQLVDIRVVDPA